MNSIMRLHENIRGTLLIFWKDSYIVVLSIELNHHVIKLQQGVK